MSHLQLVLCQSLSITGGATDSLFPRVEAWLAEDSDHYRAFERIKGKKVTTRFHSVMDFLLCEVVTRWRPECLAFYANKGPPLRDIATPGELRLIESHLLLFLTVSYEAFCQKRRLSWSKAVAIVDDILAAA